MPPTDYKIRFIVFHNVSECYKINVFNLQHFTTFPISRNKYGTKK
nr:MAG TPA: hypothetical protein [Caudoviricetes sp.]DAX93374.1 MAG TPA: hypothetical protein [Bacteriophage sp.]DAY11866.1 MAG TPA: hypothetical protein [Caudoviricetes sp.]